MIRVNQVRNITVTANHIPLMPTQICSALDLSLHAACPTRSICIPPEAHQKCYELIALESRSHLRTNVVENRYFSSLGWGNSEGCDTVSQMSAAGLGSSFSHGNLIDSTLTGSSPSLSHFPLPYQHFLG